MEINIHSYNSYLNGKTTIEIKIVFSDTEAMYDDSGVIELTNAYINKLKELKPQETVLILGRGI